MRLESLGPPGDPDPNMRLTIQNYNRFLQIVSSYLPPELAPASDASIGKWQEAIGKLPL